MNRINPALLLILGGFIQPLNADEIRHYRYDAMQRLIGVDYEGQGSIEYAYDNLGNRLVETQQTGIAPVNQPPGAVQPLFPLDGASAVETTPTIAWTPVTDPDSGDVVNYFLYFGKTATPPLLYSGAKTDFSRLCLSPASTYYWQVNARDNHNAETPGPVWSFQTQDTGHNYCELIEGFEATGSFGMLPWKRTQPATSSGWQQTTASHYEDLSAAASPQGLGNDKKASMAIQLTTAAGAISFWFAVSSAPGDYLEFYIDGVRKGRWQGEMTTWTQATIPVLEGAHTFTWQYIKNDSVSAGQDRAWVDAIFFPIPPDSAI